MDAIDDDVLLLELLWRTAQRSSRHVAWLLDSLIECSLPQLEVLRALGSSQATLASTDIASLVRCSKTNAGRLVARLESSQWVTRIRNPVDARVISVRLTARGAEACEMCEEELARGAKRLLVALDESEKEQLRALLQKVRQSLRSGLGSG